MITPFENLSENEKSMLVDAPIWVAMWVGLADNDFDQSEQIKAVKTLNIKTFSETPDIAVVYQQIENPADRLLQLMDTLPGDNDAKKEFIQQKLEAIGAVLKSMDYAYASALFKSFRNVGVHVANSTGGMLGMGAVAEEEKVALALSFMKP